MPGYAPQLENSPPTLGPVLSDLTNQKLLSFNKFSFTNPLQENFFWVKRLYICLIIDVLFQFSTLIIPQNPSFLGTQASSQATLTPPADLSFPFLKNYWTFAYGLDLPFSQYNRPIHSKAKHWLKLLIPEKESLLAAHELILEVIYQSK